MDNPRPEKVAVVDEVRERLDAADAAMLTEYRGLTVAELAELRRALRAAGGDYKIYKNTLVRWPSPAAGSRPRSRAARRPDGHRLRPGRRERGGQGAPGLRPDQPEPGGQGRRGRRRACCRPRTSAPWPTCPPGRSLLAQFAGALAAPLQQLAGLLQALPRNLAYGLTALIEQRGRRAAECARPPSRRPRGRAPPAEAERHAEAEAAPAEVERHRRGRAAPPRSRPPPTPSRRAATGAAADRRVRAPTSRCRGRTGRSDRTITDTRTEPTENPRSNTMATTKEEILDGIASLTVLELTELLKEFEEHFGVTAAAPVAVAAAPAAGGGGEAAAATRRRRVRRHPDRRRRQEDPGHQGGALPHQPRPQGGQGPGRRRAQARPREGLQGGRREGQGPARRRRGHRRAQVALAGGEGPECLTTPRSRP